MARGWESKSVEEQQAEAASSKTGPRRPRTAEQLRQDRVREGLVLSRAHLLRELATSQHPRRLALLKAALADLDAKLDHLTSSRSL